MSKTIGDLIHNNDAARQQSDASKAAAVQADQKATDDLNAYDGTQATLAKGLGKTGPITITNSDGTFSTYGTSTTSPGFRIETSKGADAVVDDDPEPVAPTEPPVEPDVNPPIMPSI